MIMQDDVPELDGDWKKWFLEIFVAINSFFFEVINFERVSRIIEWILFNWKWLLTSSCWNFWRHPSIIIIITNKETNEKSIKLAEDVASRFAEKKGNTGLYIYLHNIFA